MSLLIICVNSSLSNILDHIDLLRQGEFAKWILFCTSKNDNYHVFVPPPRKCYICVDLFSKFLQFFAPIPEGWIRAQSSVLDGYEWLLTLLLFSTLKPKATIIEKLYRFNEKIYTKVFIVEFWEWSPLNNAVSIVLILLGSNQIVLCPQLLDGWILVLNQKWLERSS